MSRKPLLLVLPLLLACSAKDEAAIDTSAALAVTPAIAPYAGMWNMANMPEGKDTVVITYQLEATGDMNGWKMTLPDRDPMDLRMISMTNDSVVSEVGPFPSALSPGTTVKLVHSTLRLDGDRLVGTSIVHYDRPGADSLLVLRQEGTRQ